MECPRHKEQLKVEDRTSTAILWKCPYPGCDYVELEELRSPAAPYDDINTWKEVKK